LLNPPFKHVLYMKYEVSTYRLEVLQARFRSQQELQDLSRISSPHFLRISCCQKRQNHCSALAYYRYNHFSGRRNSVYDHLLYRLYRVLFRYPLRLNRHHQYYVVLQQWLPAGGRQTIFVHLKSK
jgi:hypothetical protein